MALAPKYDRILDDLREDDTFGFITFGTNGITTIRWQSIVDASLWDMTIDDSGRVVTTSVIVSSTLGTPYGLLLALTQPT